MLVNAGLKFSLLVDPGGSPKKVPSRSHCPKSAAMLSLSTIDVRKLDATPGAAEVHLPGTLLPGDALARQPPRGVTDDLPALPFRAYDGLSYIVLDEGVKEDDGNGTQSGFGAEGLLPSPGPQLGTRSCTASPQLRHPGLGGPCVSGLVVFETVYTSMNTICKSMPPVDFHLVVLCDGLRLVRGVSAAPHEVVAVLVGVDRKVPKSRVVIGGPEITGWDLFLGFPESLRSSEKFRGEHRTCSSSLYQGFPEILRSSEKFWGDLSSACSSNSFVANWCSQLFWFTSPKVKSSPDGALIQNNYTSKAKAFNTYTSSHILNTSEPNGLYLSTEGLVRTFVMLEFQMLIEMLSELYSQKLIEQLHLLYSRNTKYATEGKCVPNTKETLEGVAFSSAPVERCVRGRSRTDEVRRGCVAVFESASGGAGHGEGQRALIRVGSRGIHAGGNRCEVGEGSEFTNPVQYVQESVNGPQRSCGPSSSVRACLDGFCDTPKTLDSSIIDMVDLGLEFVEVYMIDPDMRPHIRDDLCSLSGSEFVDRDIVGECSVRNTRKVDGTKRMP